jgi:hypothetical protein
LLDFAVAAPPVFGKEFRIGPIGGSKIGCDALRFLADLLELR